MKIGTKVRFIHTKGEGIIKKILDSGTVEVEIEDGFIIPVLKKEIVVVAQEEAARFSAPVTNDENVFYPEVKDKSNGVYLAFAAFNDKIYSLNIINNTSFSVLFTLGEKSDISFSGAGSGVLHPFSLEKIKEFKIADFDNWPEFFVQLLFHKNGPSEFFVPIDKKIKFKASTFYKSKKQAPLIGKEAFLYQLDKDVKPFNNEEVKQQFFSGGIIAAPPEIARPMQEVDLHIEKINAGYKTLQSGEILKFQLSYFEKQLDNAIASGMDQIIFIHGTGNGILKANIHKKLSTNQFIAYFEDARKEKFGYGATLVKIK
jgi:hypothetical protein